MVTASVESGVDTFLVAAEESHLLEDWQELTRFRGLLFQKDGTITEASTPNAKVCLPSVRDHLMIIIWDTRQPYVAATRSQSYDLLKSWLQLSYVRAVFILLRKF